MFKLKRKKNKFSTVFTIMLTLIIFLILSVANVITFCIISFLYFNGKLGGSGASFSGFLFYLLMLSTILGTVLAALANHLPFNPFNKLIKGMNELSEGHFETRLSTFGPDHWKRLAENFNAMADSLNSTEILRNDFINNFSHEFKTPIVSIRGFAKILKQNNLTDKEREEYLDIIISESTRLSALANNVLNISKIESQTVPSNPTVFNLAEQIRKSILLLESRWEEKNINLDIDLSEVSFMGSEELMTQVWVNLLDNAIKFTPNGGDIVIKLTETSDKCTFSIKDTGCGISEEKKPHIFDKFYQCDDSHSSAGNGLGLSVVQKVVQLHNGYINVNSKPNVGTQFTITLPKTLT